MKKSFKICDLQKIEEKSKIYHELLMMILIPFNYILYPITKYQYKSYSKTIFNSTYSVNEISKRLNLFLESEKLNFDPDDEYVQENVTNVREISDINLNQLINSTYWCGFLPIKNTKKNGKNEFSTLDNSNYSVNANKNVGGKIKKEDDNFSLISSVITSQLESVFSIFIMNPVWSKSVFLQVNFIIYVNCVISRFTEK